MPKKYVYRKQMGGLLDFHGFREQTETFLNGIDTRIGDESTLTTSAKGSLVAAVNELVGVDGDILDSIGDLSDLTTTDKTNLVAAINEAAASGGGVEAIYSAAGLEDSIQGRLR